MGNNCTKGGSPVQVALVEKKGEVDDSSLQVEVIDQANGSYKLFMKSELAGTYQIKVTIQGVHVCGSPATLTMHAGPPAVSQCTTEGDGLCEARAGREAKIRVLCKDQFGNVAARSECLSFGLCLAARQDVENEKKGAAKEVAKDSAKEAALIASATSMDFSGAWVEEGCIYEIAYRAQEAGEFMLHVWMEPTREVREPLVGSPFSVLVSGVRASHVGSYLGNVKNYYPEDEDEDDRDAAPGSASTEGRRPSSPTQRRLQAETKPKEPRTAKLAAGDRLVLRPQLRDEYGNASSAPEGALVAFVDGPDGVTDLPLKGLAALGAHEMSWEPQRKGLYTVHVQLGGEEITHSPFCCHVTPGMATANKTRLSQVNEIAIVNQPCELLLEAVDKFGNTLEVGGSQINARALGTSVSACTVEDNNNGSYTVAFTSYVVDTGRVIVRMDNLELSPLTVQFTASATLPTAPPPLPAGAAAPASSRPRPSRSTTPDVSSRPPGPARPESQAAAPAPSAAAPNPSPKATRRKSTEAES